MFNVDDPEQMRPEERLQEVAAILARGFARLARGGLANESGGREQECETAEQAELQPMPGDSSVFLSD